MSGTVVRNIHRAEAGVISTLERLAAMTIEDFMRRGGNEGAEVIMWLIMRGALDAHAKMLHQNYYLPMTTAMAVALFE